MMPVRVGWVASLLWLGMPLPVHGQPVRCDLLSCIDFAYGRHPVLRGAEAARQEAQAERAQRLAEQRPSLTAELAAGYFAGERIAPFDVLRRLESGEEQGSVSGPYYGAGATINVPIYSQGAFIGSTPSSVRAAEFGVSAKETQLRALRAQVASAVVEAYSTLARATAAQATLERIATLRQGAQRLAQEQFRRERLSKRDMLLVDTRSAEAQRDVAVNLAHLQRARVSMGAALGLGPGESVEVQEGRRPNIPVPRLAMQALIEQAVHLSPDIRAQELRVEQAKAEAARIKAEDGPDLSLRLFGGHADDLRGLPHSASQRQAMLLLRVPIIDFGRSDSKYAAAQAKIVSETARLDTLRLQVGREVSELYYRFSTSGSELELLRARLAAAREDVTVARAMVERDLAPASAAADAEADFLRLENAVAETEREQEVLRFRLNLAVAQ
jgi:outer membrane protein TolC